MDIGYSHAFIGRWREGEMPKVKEGNTVVSYDQRYTAYDIDQEDADDFVEWVAVHWEIERAPIEEGESAADYLDRIGVSVYRVS